MKDSRRDARIPPEELSAWERWELPLLDARGEEVAREEERDVKPLTAADIEEIRRSAWEEGRAEGREAGHREGFAEGRVEGHEEGRKAGLEEGLAEGRETGMEQTRSEVNEKLARLEQLMGDLLQPISRHQDELESALVNLATVLSRAVLFRELALDSSQIRAVVAQALAALPAEAANARIRVNPADAQWVREVAEQLEAGTSVIEDGQILAGGCKVETRHTLVDFTVEKRFQKAVQAMLDEQLAVVGESEELDAMMGDLSDFHRDLLSEPASPPELEPEPEPAPENPTEGADPAPSDDDTGTGNDEPVGDSDPDGGEADDQRPG